MAEVSVERIEEYLRQLCEEVPDRHVGGPGNHEATRLFATTVAAFGHEVETVELPCLRWEAGTSSLEAGGRGFDLLAGPYSHPFEGRAVLTAASTVEELESGDFAGTVLLLHGAVAAEQLVPKNYPFYNLEPHQRIIAALEAARPAAAIAATGIDPGMAGGLYPFPLFEDGDFELPNAYLTDLDGEVLLGSVGTEIALRIDSKRIEAIAEQPIAHIRGTADGRILLLAHIDSKNGTPGALDNASGVAALLGAAELLRSYGGGPSIELWPFNGEDYYAATGQRYFVERNRGRLGDIVVGLNVDGAGYVGARTAVSLYGAGEGLSRTVLDSAEGLGFVEGPQWPQGDHSILAMAGVPAVAVTSENAFFVASTVAHTPEDTIDKLDVGTVAQVARFLADVVERVGASDGAISGT